MVFDPFDPLKPLREDFERLDSGLKRFQQEWDKALTAEKKYGIFPEAFRELIIKISLPFAELEEMRQEYSQDLATITDEVERKLLQDIISVIDQLLELIHTIRESGRF